MVVTEAVTEASNFSTTAHRLPASSDSTCLQVVSDDDWQTDSGSEGDGGVDGRLEPILHAGRGRHPGQDRH